MNLSEEVDLEDYVSRPDKISAAEVRFFTSIIGLVLRMLYGHVELGYLYSYQQPFRLQLSKTSKSRLC